MTATLKATANQKQDVKYLERNAPAKGAYVPAPATVSMAQLYEVERLANIGANLYQIGVALRVPEALWQEMITRNPAIADAYVNGYNRMQIECLGQIKAQALQGDASLLRLLADRGFLGPQMQAPKQQPAVSVSVAPGAHIDVIASVDAAFARQRALIEGRTVDVEAEAEAPGP